jgi:hypothetical protein
MRGGNGKNLEYLEPGKVNPQFSASHLDRALGGHSQRVTPAVQVNLKDIQACQLLQAAPGRNLSHADQAAQQLPIFRKRRFVKLNPKTVMYANLGKIQGVDRKESPPCESIPGRN